jgi:hypothetical protein
MGNSVKTRLSVRGTIFLHARKFSLQDMVPALIYPPPFRAYLLDRLPEKSEHIQIGCVTLPTLQRMPIGCQSVKTRRDTS